MNYLLKMLGHLIIFWDGLWGVKSRITELKNNNADLSLDHTGKLVRSSTNIKNISSDTSVVYPDYKDNLSHSLWRAQELTLFKMYSNLLLKPAIDLGCGDGTFSKMIFPSIDFGIDPDREAIKIASECGLYDHCVCSYGDFIPLPEKSVKSIFSNSVLEHVDNLEGVLRQASNLLSDNGCFIFTVPNLTFASDLQYLFGKKESVRMNREFYHKNLYSEKQWRILLEDAGLKAEKIIYYQPKLITFVYRFLAAKIIRIISRKIVPLFWNMFEPLFVKLIKYSISSQNKGSNFMIIARKTVKE
jgi:SAM-dependent methyltransferase